MSILNLRNDDWQSAPKSKKPLKLVLGIGALVGVIALGSTFASNISLNNGNGVEFGQGVAQSTACDNEVLVTPYSTFVNAVGAGDFVFTSISVSGISSQCDGKIFTLKAYKEGQNNSLDLYETYGAIEPFNEVQVLDSAGTFSFIGGGLLGDDITNFTGGFTVTMVTNGPPPSIALASALDVDRITIESSNATCAQGGRCVLGDTGSGGGTVFYVNNAGFSCGPDFSNTGSPTGGLCHYLEAASTSGTDAWTDVQAVWSENTTDYVWQASGIGGGFKQTIAMINQVGAGTTGAGNLAQAYRGPFNKIDWYLPTLDELYQLSLSNRVVKDLKKCGGGNPWWYQYWSTDEYAGAFRACLDDGTGAYGGFDHSGKNTQFFVRPIRAF